MQVTINIKPPSTHPIAKLTITDQADCYFTILDGELLEWADDLGTADPNWDEAGCCDPVRGESPELQAYLRSLLEQAAVPA